MQNDTEQMDFLAIGDIVTDAFIRVNDAKIIPDPSDSTSLLAFRYGDKVPYEFVEEVRAVGNCANAAVAVARLGLKSALLAHVGKDTQGQACLDELTKNNVGTHYVFSHEGIPTTTTMYCGTMLTALSWSSIKYFRSSCPISLSRQK